MLFGQKRLENNLCSTFLPIFAPMKTYSKHDFSAPFNYAESLSKFEILTNAFSQHGLVHAFWPKTAKNQLCSTFASNDSKNHSKHHFSAPFNYAESLRKFEILTKFSLKGLVRLKTNFFWPKTAKNQLSSTLLPMTPMTLKNYSKNHCSAPFNLRREV